MSLELNNFLQKYKGWIENGFWLTFFIFVYILMMKAMHPGWNIFGF